MAFCSFDTLRCLETATESYRELVTTSGCKDHFVGNGWRQSRATPTGSALNDPKLTSSNLESCFFLVSLGSAACIPREQVCDNRVDLKEKVSFCGRKQRYDMCYVDTDLASLSILSSRKKRNKKDKEEGLSKKPKILTSLDVDTKIKEKKEAEEGPENDRQEKCVENGHPIINESIDHLC